MLLESTFKSEKLVLDQKLSCFEKSIQEHEILRLKVRPSRRITVLYEFLLAEIDELPFESDET